MSRKLNPNSFDGKNELLSHLSVVSTETRVQEKVPLFVLPARSNEATLPISTGAFSEEA